MTDNTNTGEQIPEDVPYMIVFDDADRKPEILIGRDRAMQRYADVSVSWNAHLFVKVDSNSRDCTMPSAALSQLPQGVDTDELMAETRRGDMWQQKYFELTAQQGAQIPASLLAQIKLIVHAERLEPRDRLQRIYSLVSQYEREVYASPQPPAVQPASEWNDAIEEVIALARKAGRLTVEEICTLKRQQPESEQAAEQKAQPVAGAVDEPLALLDRARKAGFGVMGGFVMPPHPGHITAELEKFAALLAAPSEPKEGERDKVDAERLDFLDRNAKFRMGWKVGVAPAGNVSITSVIMGGKPIREAIDDARADQEKAS